MHDPLEPADHEAAFRERLDSFNASHGAADPHMAAEIVRSVLATINGDPRPRQTSVFSEIEELGRIISDAKAEIASVGVEDITASHIPLATDELDAIVAHTASATDSILETCETLDRVANDLTRVPPSLSGLAASQQLQEATTRIYEACGFQDITGQRITKVVAALKAIEAKVNHIVATFGGGVIASEPRRAPDDDRSDAEKLLNGPQSPMSAMDQSDIDKLLASFD